jgi:hypothetical protein
MGRYAPRPDGLAVLPRHRASGLRHVPELGEGEHHIEQLTDATGLVT